MDLKSGYPWWAVRNGLMHAFPRLGHDLACDVAVVGGGITGALIASEFAGHGHDVVVLEQRDMAWGSTAASTALLQYEIDTHLVDLAKQVGQEDAAMAYRACVASVEALETLLPQLGDVGYRKSDSLYFASRARDRRRLRSEFEARACQGFDVQWLDQAAVRAGYGFDADAAILNRPAAGVDPYRFAMKLLQRLEQAGYGIFDRTSVEAVEPRRRDVVLRTGDGHRIVARHVV
ncbi:MAG: FAD-binding oxidoreductase, partial [Lysobacteraceae bacterium]